MASIVVYENQIIASGINTREQDHQITSHAEINALKQAAQVIGSWNLTGSSLYVNLEPCAMCAGAILQSHISTVVFGAYDAKSGAFGSRYNLITKNLNVIGGIMEQECAQRLTEFFEQLR